MNTKKISKTLVCLLSLVLIGCSPNSEPAGEIKSIEDLVGKRCGFVVGGSVDRMLQSLQPGIEFEPFNDFASTVEALRAGKIDAMPVDKEVARQWVAARPGELRLGFTFSGNLIGYFFKKGSPLRDRVNSVLDGMKKSGELDRIISKWTEAEDIASVEQEKIDASDGFTGKGGKLRFVCDPEMPPGIFIRDGGVVGFDMDIVRRVARELDMELEIQTVSFGALVPAVQSGKADMGGGCVTISSERKEKVDFTEGHCDLGYAVVVRDDSADKPFSLRGEHVAHMSSDVHREELEELCPGAIYDPYTEFSFAFESLRKGKIKAVSLGRTFADIWMAKFPGEFAVAMEYADDACGFVLVKGSPLTARLSDEIRKMNEAGETEAIIAKWCDAVKTGAPAEIPAPTAPEGAPVVRVAAAAATEPFCYVRDNVVVGADTEILATVANRLGIRLDMKIYSWPGMMDAVNAAKADVGMGNIYIKSREMTTVDATEPYATEKMCVLVKTGARAKADDAGFIESIMGSFHRTFVVENRWRMMLDGLCITMLITLASGLLGTLLAFPVWMARTSRVKAVSSCAKAYISVMQGTPILVLLMVLFYIVFGSVDIDGILVAIIGFALNASAYVGEMLRSGIDSVPCGQTEAALALGYSPRRAFMRFVLPQAIRAILPVYRGEMIGLLKSTSIVGYIAISDLTKASDLIRSRTYESFFPILTTAFIYFAVAWLLAAVLNRFGRMLDPAAKRK